MISIQLIICRQEALKLSVTQHYIVYSGWARYLKSSAKLDTIVVFITTKCDLLKQQIQHLLVNITQ
jgi:hypothetical protein